MGCMSDTSSFSLLLAIENFRTNYSNWLGFRENSDDVSNEENVEPYPMRSLEVGGARLVPIYSP